MLANYQLGLTLYQSAQVTVVRAKRRSDDTPVVLKVFARPQSGAEELSRIRREYEIHAGLVHPGIAQVFGLHRDQARWYIEMEDFGGDAFAKLKTVGGQPLAMVLDAAAQVAEVLAFIHSHGVVHKDINPANILLNPQTQKIKVIDFGIATALHADTTQYYDLPQLEGTLPYLSPEQTGRMNRGVDGRSDFYSFGATLYELLTGHPPFPAADPMEIVHSHLARMPVPVQQVRPEVPATVSDIVHKLLAKDPEDRYQTAHGLRADLQQAAELLRQGAPVQFTLGQHDVSQELQIPKKLYGRQRHVNTLLGVFDRVANGATRMVLVAGPAGIGKSTLVHELYKPLTTHRGHFISGKFDQLQRNTPYQAIILAVRQLVRHLLTEDADAVQTWRGKILAAVANQGRVVTDVVPEAELILGEQAPLSELGPSETKHRFERIFQRFMGVFADSSHPLVLFLDDLQWADRGSIDLLRSVFMSPDTSHFMVIAAYRDGEITPGHPFGRFIEEMRQLKNPAEQVQLAALGEVEVSAWLQDMLRVPAADVRDLASVALEKTAGNPFFLAEYFKALVPDGMLQFETATGQWRWDMARIRQSASTRNVADLLAAKIKRLSPRTQDLLHLAAVIGNQFALGTLANITQQSPHATAVALQEAVQSGMIVPLSELHELSTVDAEATDLRVEYKFAHDRVQGEVLNSIAAAQRAPLHHQVAKYLTAFGMGENAVFEIVNHYHAARDLLGDDDERLNVVRLCLHAGMRAAESAAYGAALVYHRHGIELLRGAWVADLTAALHIEAARMAMLSAEFALMEELVDTVRAHSKNKEELAAALEIKMLGMSGQGKLMAALQVGGEVLQLMGASVPNKPTKADVLRELAKTRWLLRGLPPEAPLSYPPMTDARALIVARCCMQMLSAAYYASSDLYVLLVLLQVRTSHTYGNSPWSPFSWAAYGTVYCMVFKNYDVGYRYAEMATNLAQKLNVPAQGARASVLLHGFVGFWKRPVADCAKALLQTHQDCVDVGDTEYACHALYIGAYNRLFGGEELSKLDAQMQIDADAIGRLKQERSLISLRIWWQGVRNLRGLTQNLWRLCGDVYDESAMLPKFRESNNVHGLANTYVVRLLLSYLFGRTEEAVENARLAQQYLGVFKSVSVPSWYHFYAALTYLQAAETAVGAKRQRHMVQANKSIKLLVHWADKAPVNHAAKMLLVCGERARLQGHYDRAESLFEQGVAAAQKAGFISEEAVGYELLARVYTHKNRPQLRTYFLNQAYAAYGQWGATAKMQAMEMAHPELSTVEFNDVMALRSDVTNSPTTRKTANLFDMESVFRASQAISGIIDIRALSERLMNLVMENAGAQRGVLLLVNQERLTLAMDSRQPLQPAVGDLSTQQARQTVPLDMVNYVRRTQGTVVLPGEHDALFATDPYFKQASPRSVLCLPLLNQGSITAVLYLENDLTLGAFTDRRVSLLQLLSSQVALAIDNARLYDGLERQVEERTRELQESQDKVLRLQKTALEVQMAGGFAHEMRNALSASSNLLGTVLDKENNVCDATADDLGELLAMLRPELPQELLTDVQRIMLRIVGHQELLQEALEGISQATTRSQRITTQILEYAQLGRMERRHGEVSLRAVLQEVSQDFATRQIGAGSVGLTVQTITEDLHIKMDESHLYAVLRNLVANARDAIHETARADGKIHVSVQHQPGAVILKVADNGAGIPEHVQPRLFEPFFTTKGIRGTGLGLGIVKRITELYDGSLQFATTVGSGTEFLITLPVKEGES